MQWKEQGQTTKAFLVYLLHCNNQLGLGMCILKTLKSPKGNFDQMRLLVSPVNFGAFSGELAFTLNLYYLTASLNLIVTILSCW